MTPFLMCNAAGGGGKYCILGLLCIANQPIYNSAIHMIINRNATATVFFPLCSVIVVFAIFGCVFSQGKRPFFIGKPA